MIVEREYLPGDLIRLAALAERIGSSVTPVREALLLLMSDGWVVQEPNRGFRVIATRRRDMLDANDLYVHATGELTARAAPLVTASDIELLRELDASMRARSNESEVAYLLATNQRLHRTIYRIADSPALMQVVRTVTRFAPRPIERAFPGWIEHNRDNHAAIIDALEVHDETRARTAMSDYIRVAGELLLAYLDSIGFWVER